MKEKFSLTIAVLIVGFTAWAQQKDYSADTRTLESTIHTLYAVISGAPGEARDWDRFLNLFGPGARLIPTRKDNTGKLIYQPLSPDEYVKLFSSRIATGFYERELSKTVEQYGTVVHTFSTYETRETQRGPVTNRGINSIQLFTDNDRYYIVTIFWCAESMGFELPEKYLSK